MMSIELNKIEGLYKFRVIDSELIRQGYKDVKGIYWQEDKVFCNSVGPEGEMLIRQICSRCELIYKFNEYENKTKKN